MNKQETGMLLNCLEDIFPNTFKNLGAERRASMLETYSALFADKPFAIVVQAVRNMATTTPDFSVAALSQHIKQLDNSEQTEAELWNILHRAVCNSAWSYMEEFEKLPPILQKAVGSPRQLYDYSQMNAETLNTVVRGHFLKTIGSVKEKHEAQEELKRLESKGPESLAAILGDMKKLPER